VLSRYRGAVDDRPVSLWRNRDFVLLWSGQVASTLGSRVSSLAFPLLALAMTHSPAKAGLIGLAGGLPNLLLQLPAGVFVDRWNRRRTMLVADAGRALALASLAIALAAGDLTFIQLLIVAAVENALGVFFDLAELAAISVVVPATQLTAAVAQNEARRMGTTLAGAPLGGVLYQLGRLVPFVVDSASYVVSLITLLAIRSEFRQPEAEPQAPQRLHESLAEGMRWLWRQPFLRSCAVLVAGSNFVFSAMALLALVVARRHGASPAAVGLMFAMFGVGGLLGAAAAPWLQRSVPARLVVIGANWVWLAAVPLVIVAPAPILLGLVLAAMAFCGPIWNVVIVGYRMAIVPDRLQGRVNSAARLIAMSASPLGPPIAGLLLSSAGSLTADLALTGVTLALALAATLDPNLRHLPPIPEVRPT
jgi:predicted MFS family arabinose efflux permease